MKRPASYKKTLVERRDNRRQRDRNMPGILWESSASLGPEPSDKGRSRLWTGRRQSGTPKRWHVYDERSGSR